MSQWLRSRQDGISLKSINIYLITLAVMVSLYMLYSANSLSGIFKNMSEATDSYIEMHKTAESLLDTTEYMTEMVQRYTLDADSMYLRNYFSAVAEMDERREQIKKLLGTEENAGALAKLQHAMDKSAELKETEFYAARMVAEATGLSPIPEQLENVHLEPQHAMLPSREKKEAAQHMVSDEAYYRKLDRIREEMKDSLTSLEDRTLNVMELSDANVRQGLLRVRIVTLIQTIAILTITQLLSHFGITPILKAVDKLHENSQIPVMGANEFQYLAKTYNNMFDAYEKSVETLNFKANHDELTMAYNRNGYDLLMEKMESGMEDSAMLLMDVDYFKEVNDSYGHETGDRVLQKVVSTITGNFRSVDHVCRIGGDEFVVIMLNTNLSHKNQIAEKVFRINEMLQQTEDGLPAVSVSAGVAFRDRSMTDQNLYECADQALYHTKRNGKKGVSFYCDL